MLKKLCIKWERREKTRISAHLRQNFKNIIISSNFSLKLLLTVIQINFLPESVYICRSIKCFAQKTIYNRNELLKHHVECATLEAITGLVPKCVSQLFLGLLLLENASVSYWSIFFPCPHFQSQKSLRKLTRPSFLLVSYCVLRRVTGPGRIQEPGPGCIKPTCCMERTQHSRKLLFYVVTYGLT